MFGKLLKNDLKAQWHSVNIILLCLAIICVAAEVFAMVCKNNMLSVLSGLLVFAVLVFACIVMVIAVSMLFSKTRFSFQNFTVCFSLSTKFVLGETFSYI